MNDLKFTTTSDYMNTDTKFDDLMYRAGLTAQGCWDEMDEYDRNAIQKFAELIIKETLQVARAGIEYGPGMEDAVYKYFGVEE